MLERDMEDLIAAHPKDFFNKEFTLIGRQQSFADVGRFDLLFKDEFGWMILVELKARVAKYEDATQLAKYKDELVRRNETSVIMWLVAPHIPGSIREFLDGIGIEYTEIHEAQFRRVAQRYGKTLSRDPQPEMNVGQMNGGSKPITPRSPIVKTSKIAKRGFNPIHVGVGPTVSAPPSFKWKNVGFDLILDNPQDFDRNRFTELIKSFEISVPSAKNSRLVEKLIEWGSNPVNNRFTKYICFRLLRWVTTSGWQQAVPHAEAIWIYLFGSPVPTWYRWNRSTKTYLFDTNAWKVWFDSLRNSLRSTEAIYKEHNHESARDWPAKDQCQCQDCQNYRKAHPSTSSL
ncbi:MAG TPA: endonuclease NucS domain-containing protein [Candidatus Angelobacter sp.]|jgi:hypothetical protein